MIIFLDIGLPSHNAKMECREHSLEKCCCHSSPLGGSSASFPCTHSSSRKRLCYCHSCEESRGKIECRVSHESLILFHWLIFFFTLMKSTSSFYFRKFEEQITSQYDDVGMRCERDAFDTLFDHAPEKLQVVKKSLVTFVNKHLNKLNFEVVDLGTDFRDGVYLCLLMGLLGGFFTPLHEFHLTPKDTEQMIHNVAFSFMLMQDVGLAKPKARPEDIVNRDLKSTLRCLYNLFTKYRNIA